MTSAPTLLVVDDEPDVRQIVGEFARRAGFRAEAAVTGRDAIARVRDCRIDVALVDLCMPDAGGLDVVRAVRQSTPSCRLVVITGYGSVETAVEAIKLGVLDYFQKPIDFKRLGRLLRALLDEIVAVPGDAGRPAGDSTCCGMVGGSAPMQDLFRRMRRLAAHARVVLITGETGTGKELAAKAFHELGPRRSKHFVPVNCAAIVDALVESELFGHVRGAFTGAAANKPGLFEAADGGTLFLDEVGELALATQAKLLRVLELGDVRRVGSLESRKVDVHLVAATNRDLVQAVADGRFRGDLYYRLNIVDLQLPPLRERVADIDVLTSRFLHECATRLGKPVRGLTPAARRRLAQCSWPGNVRELRNAVERACILAEGDLITEQDLGDVCANPAQAPAGERSRAAPACRTRVREVPLERHEVERALQQSGGNKQLAAARLGLSRRAFYRRLEELDLESTIVRRQRGTTGT